MFKTEGSACAKALGVWEELGKGLCAGVERVDGRVADEAGEGARARSAFSLCSRSCGKPIKGFKQE